MISLIDSSTTTLLSLALEATTMRHQAIAHNIANASTPGYRPVSVSFEEFMTDAKHALKQGGSVPHSAIANYRPMFDMATIEETGADAVSLDMEVAKLSQNTLHHQALLKALNRHFSIIGTAISEGKR
ncbi:MAG TPA: flagellar basal body rod protein FlgB [Noviherbaspirillum sp.]|nr:flagellar basal body rod protein FlgB [Noviherbaspirillum sp.]